MKKHPRKATPFFIAAVTLIALILLAFVATREDLKVESYHLESEKVTKEVRLVMLSDLHGSYYGQKQQKLLEEIDGLSPHAILLVGDIFDENTAHDAAKDLLSGICEKYPCYYVSGNHEYSTDFEEIKSILAEYGVTCLWGEGTTVTLNGQELFLAGISDDNHTYSNQSPKLPFPYYQFDQLEAARTEEEKGLYSILLCHRPYISMAQNSGYDLVLSGHNHGGQVRLPGILNGLFSPGEGLFPKYAGGRYDLNDQTTLVIGRGLAKNQLPRVFNRPEVVYIEITPMAD